MEIWSSGDKEVLLDGPAGTGKSRGWLEKLHFAAIKYPQSRQLIVRKTRASLTQTTLVTFEQHVVPFGDPVLKGAGRAMRQSYSYPNGSEIVVAGLDNPQKIMSSEYDRIYVPEAIEVNEADWEMLMTRLRNGRMGYHQIGGDCNPDAPTHWIPNRETLTRISSRHEDNPVLYDHKLGCWTPAGLEYIETLDLLTGHRKDRLRYGIWCSAEGARFTQLDAKVHLFDMEDRWPQGLPQGYRVIMGVDYGLRAPYCALWIAIDYDGDAYVFREDYQDGITADVQAERMVNLTHANETIYQVYADPAIWAEFPKHIPEPGPSLRSTAEFYAKEFDRDIRFGGMIPGYNKSRKIALDTLDALLNRGNGYPNLFIERKACPNLWRELCGAVWDERGTKEDIDPKCPDHCLVGSTLVLTENGEVPIREVMVGDRVMTRNGWKSVTQSWQSGDNARTVVVHLSNGRTLQGTPNHRVWSETSNSWVEMAQLVPGEVLCSACAGLNSLLGTESSLDAIRTREDLATGCTSVRMGSSSTKASRLCIGRFGKRRLVQSRKGGTSTTSTGMRQTTGLRTLSALPLTNTFAGTSRTGESRDCRSRNGELLLAPFADRSSRPTFQRASYALRSAGRKSGANQERTTKPVHAWSAVRPLLPIGSARSNPVPVVVERLTPGPRADVFDLTVDGEHEFFAQGVLVHNSITALYYALHTHLGPPKDTGPKPLPPQEVLDAARAQKRHADLTRRFKVKTRHRF